VTSDDQSTPADDQFGLPPEIEKLIKDLTGGADLPPELREMLSGAGLEKIDPQVMAMMAGQLQSLFTGGGDADGGLDATSVTDLARKVIASDGDPSISEKGAREVADAVRVADLWLDPITELTASGLTGVAWSRSEWVEQTMPAWVQLIEPIAEGVTGAIHGALGRQLGSIGEGGLPEGMLPPGMNPAAMMGQVESMMRRVHGSLFSMQVGQGLGALSGELLSGTEPTLPLVSRPTVALLSRNIAEFAEGLDLPASEVLLYAAVREVARARLFHSVPWLGTQLLAAVRDYGSGIVIDTEAIESSLTSIDATNPDAVREALEGRLFAPPERTPAQLAALARLEASLALVEGWVDVVSSAAVRSTLPHAEALGEAIRRRRATGGPAEKTFAALVGLELRPRRLRDAANLFAALEARGGAALRDRAWQHPDLAPSAADLDDVLGYVERLTTPVADEMDAALAQLLADAQSSDQHEGKGEGDGDRDGGQRPESGS